MDDPYVPPARTASLADAETLRRGHLGRETTYRTSPVVWVALGVLLALLAVLLYPVA